MNEFKPGDRVKCIDIDGDESGGLELNRVYTVETILSFAGEDRLVFKECRTMSRVSRNRFVPVESIH